MARKRKKEWHGPTPAKDAVRKAFGKAMFNDAEFAGMLKHQLGMLIKGDQVGALQEVEKRHILMAQQEIERAERRILAVARRIQRGV